MLPHCTNPYSWIKYQLKSRLKSSIKECIHALLKAVYNINILKLGFIEYSPDWHVNGRLLAAIFDIHNTIFTSDYHEGNVMIVAFCQHLSSNDAIHMCVYSWSYLVFDGEVVFQYMVPYCMVYIKISHGLYSNVTINLTSLTWYVKRNTQTNVRQ